MLTVTITHLKEGYIRRNGMPRSDRATVTEHWLRHGDFLTIATIVNDLVTCGARPISVAMHAAVGDSGWFSDAKRMELLVDGWAEGCRRAGAGSGQSRFR